MTPPAERMRKTRDRQRRGARVYRIELPDSPVIDAFLESEWLTDSQSRDPAMVEKAVAEVILRWAKKWRYT